MDLETGEVGCSRDCETGEWVPYEDFDNETGEYESGDFSNSSYPTSRTTFKIPNSYMNKTKHSLSRSQRQTTRDMSPALLFLLPTLFVYPGITSIIVAFLEVIIHTWAHRINKKLTNKNVYYKSPMHIIASEFCAKCRDIKSMDKIEKLQDKRTLRFKCNEYVKRIVT